MEGFFIAQICIFAGNFAPRGWAFCQGQLLPIDQYDALFALIGTTYGGDGQTTFGLPDLRGRAPLHPGQGPGLSPHVIGEMAGVEQVTLTTNNLPNHNHTAAGKVAVASGSGSLDTPVNNVLAGTPNPVYTALANQGGSMGGVSTTPGIAGGSQPFNARQAYLAVNFVICLEGIFPSRN